MANTYTVNGASIEEAFTFHAPTENQIVRYQKLRDKAKEMAYLIGQVCPDGRPKSLAITKLEEAIMWANKAIAHEVTE